MKSSFFYCMGIISVLLLVSCGEKRIEAPLPAVESPIAQPSTILQEKLRAEVSADALRVRVFPYLDSEILGHLMKGNTVLVESRTEWTQSIGNLDSCWFFVRADGYSGWTYGGYLDFGTAEGNSVPADPGIAPPEKEAVDSTASESNARTAPVVLNPSSLPEILLPVIGLENEAPVIDSAMYKERAISYNSKGEQLVLPFSDSPDSALGGFALGEKTATPGKLHIIAESQGGAQSYEAYLERSDCEILPGRPGRILVDFYSLATLNAGSWEIYAFLGDNNWPAAVGKIEIEPAPVSLVPVRNPNPLIDSPRSNYSSGDRVYAFGRQESDSGNLQLALYHESDEYREGDMLLRPLAALQLQSDSSGYWFAEFLLDESMPPGRYWAAVGSPIKGFENLFLFITSIYNGNIS